MTIDLDSTLAQAEVLFLSFAQLVADIDRRKADMPPSSGQLRHRGTGGEGSSSSTTEADAAVLSRLDLSEDLRGLLTTAY
jgi:TBC1 domain family member 15